MEALLKALEIMEEKRGQKDSYEETKQDIREEKEDIKNSLEDQEEDIAQTEGRPKELLEETSKKKKKKKKKKAKTRQDELYNELYNELSKECGMKINDKEAKVNELLEECDRKISEQQNRAYREGKNYYRIGVLVNYAYLTEREEKIFLEYLSERYTVNRKKHPYINCRESFRITRIFSKYYIRSMELPFDMLF